MRIKILFLQEILKCEMPNAKTTPASAKKARSENLLRTF